MECRRGTMCFSPGAEQGLRTFVSGTRRRNASRRAWGAAGGGGLRSPFGRVLDPLALAHPVGTQGCLLTWGRGSNLGPEPPIPLPTYVPPRASVSPLCLRVRPLLSPPLLASVTAFSSRCLAVPHSLQWMLWPPPHPGPWGLLDGSHTRLWGGLGWAVADGHDLAHSHARR